MPAEGRGLGSRLALEAAKHGRLGQRERNARFIILVIDGAGWHSEAIFNMTG